MCYGYAVTVDINSDNAHAAFLETDPAEKSRPLKIWVLLMRLGAATGCHQMRERSFFFRKYQFPVCARCTGLLAGQTAGIALFLIFLNFNIKLLLLCTAFSVVLLGTDGFFQLKGIWVSTNFRRLFTGTLCGFFVTGFFIRIVVMLITRIVT